MATYKFVPIPHDIIIILVTQPSFCIGKPELRILLKELYTKAADKWEDIGIMLKIDSRRLDALKTTVNGTAQSCLREMLKLWLKTIDPPPSWSAMADALENLGDEALASHLRENYTVIVQREAAV